MRAMITAIGSAAVLLALCHTAEAADPRILIVKSDDIPQYAATIESFSDSVTTATRVVDMKGSREVGEALLRKALGGGRPRAVFALGGQAAWLSRRILPDTPMVFAMVLGWERYGLDKGPVAGVAVEVPARDALTRLKLVFPQLSKIGVISSPHTLPHRTAAISKAAAELSVEVVEEKVLHSSDTPGAYRRMRTEVDALWMLPDPLVVTRDNFAYLEEQCRRDGVAFLAFSENFVRAGALASVSPSYETMGSQAAALLARLLENNAEPPAVQTPLGSKLVINSAVVEALGLTIAPEALKMADMVIGAGDE